MMGDTATGILIQSWSGHGTLKIVIFHDISDCILVTNFHELRGHDFTVRNLSTPGRNLNPS